MGSRPIEGAGPAGHWSAGEALFSPGEKTVKEKLWVQINHRPCLAKMKQEIAFKEHLL